MAEKEKHKVLLSSRKTCKSKDMYIMQHFSSCHSSKIQNKTATKYMEEKAVLAIYKQKENLNVQVMSLTFFKCHLYFNGTFHFLKHSVHCIVGTGVPIGREKVRVKASLNITKN